MPIRKDYITGMPRIEIKLSEIPLDKPLRVEQPETPIVLVRNGNSVAAYLDRCPHAHWPLSEGELEGGILHCSGHGWQFDAGTGLCLNAPAYRLKALSVSLLGDIVFVDWNEADLNSETSIGDR